MTRYTTYTTPSKPSSVLPEGGHRLRLCCRGIGASLFQQTRRISGARAFGTLFPTLKRFEFLRFWHFSGFGALHLLLCPVLERVGRRSMHRMPGDTGPIIFRSLLARRHRQGHAETGPDRKITRLNSSHSQISY